MRVSRVVSVLAIASLAACHRSSSNEESAGDVSVLGRMAAALGFGPASDSLGDSRAIPHYTTRSFSPEERDLLRAAFGVEDPSRLYVADSAEDGLLKYDTKVKRCLECFVNTYGIGFISVRRPGETWEQAEQRVHAMKRKEFPPTALVESVSLASLSPDVQPTFQQMLNDARTAGFDVHVVATYRSPEREAFLMSLGRARTHTLTSMHSYGRAIDVVIDEGNIRRAKTRTAWIAFRKWLVAYDHREFHVLGQPDHSWDWRHIELPTDSIGFRSIDGALTAARKCTANDADASSCTFQPRLPPGIAR